MSLKARIDAIRETLAAENRGVVETFDIYANEALFGIELIASDIRTLPKGAKILDVGAGICLLSTELAAMGYEVHALEPISDGFGHIDFLQKRVIETQPAATNVRLLRIKAEDLAFSDFFDYAFSVNVMEHVDDVRVCLERIVRALAPAGTYRFECPNYHFPYEQHFNVPILGSKNLTWRLFRQQIERSTMSDPLGTWRSLNWINCGTIKKCGDIGAEIRFSNEALSHYLSRCTADREFVARKGWLFRLVALALSCRPIHNALSAIPYRLSPVLDCRFVKLQPGRQ